MALIETRSFGCGVGLRSPHYPVVTEEWPEMDWFEAISENYMDTGGRPFHILEKVRQHYPVALHGTALSLGSSDDLNPQYLERLKRLDQAIEPFIVSDHLCWSGIGGDHLHDLLPLPFTEEALRHVSARIMQVQEFLGRRILIENVSAYVTFKHSTMTEWEFLNGVAERADCGILLDVNNIYVNSVNHGFNPKDYVRAVAGERVLQMHVAGHTDMGTYLFDTHSKAIIDPVWDLYEQAIGQWGPISTLIEWDEDIPGWECLSEEAAKARKIYAAHADQKQKINDVPRVSRRDLGSVMSPQKLSDISLVEIQETLGALIEKPEDASIARARLDAVLNPQGGVSGGERAAVYAGGLPARFHESLTEVYDAVLRILGPEEFAEMAHAYTYRYPSHDYNLNHAGRHLPEFILDSPKISDFPFLAELARLEWHIWEAFHAFDGPALDPAGLAAVPAEAWDGACLYFQPSLRLMKSEWNVFELWFARHSQDTPRPRQSAARILIGRRQDQIRCELLDPAQYFLMEGLLKGEPLGRVCEDLAALQISDDTPVSDWFARWIQDGLIQRCEFLPRKSGKSPRSGRPQKAKA